MAIENQTQLVITQQKIAKLELSLDRMRQRETPTAYAILSQGVVAQIEQMRHEIDEYLGILPVKDRDSEILVGR